MKPRNRNKSAPGADRGGPTFWGFVLLLFIGGFGGCHGVSLGYGPDDEAAAVAERLYARFTGYTTSVDMPGVAFKLSNFEMVGPGDWGSRRWTEVVTMPGGEMIDAERQVTTSADRESVQYAAAWSTGPSWWDSAEAKSRGSSTVAEALDLIRAARPDFANARSITSFQVVARFRDRARTYRAALVRVDDPTEGQFVAVDNITQGVEAIGAESLPRGGDPESPPEGTPPDVLASGACRAWSSTTSTARSASSGDGHIAGGAHRATAQLGATCSCTSACRSTCSASAKITCADSWWDALICHKMASATNASTRVIDDGRTAGAACAAGTMCAQKACAFCVCALSASVSIVGSGGGVSFGESGGPDWKATFPYSRACARCVP